MEPIDRIKARASAFEVLGLAHRAGSDEVRAAWRSIVFRAHPDHRHGDGSEFTEAKKAYDFLRAEGLAGKDEDDETSAMPRRPTLQSRVIDLNDEDTRTCHRMLNANPATPQKTAISPSNHVPDVIECSGRNLIYHIPTPVTEGANRVALPTSILTVANKKDFEVLTFNSKNSGYGELVVPEPIRQRKFPGAKSVSIRFGSHADHSESDRPVH